VCVSVAVDVAHDPADLMAKNLGIFCGHNGAASSDHASEAASRELATLTLVSGMIP
jgi:hypothetical protein